MDDEKLIALVAECGVLYDKSCSGYKLPKRDIWCHIATQLNCSDMQCAKRWLSLREKYSREMRRFNAPSRRGAAYQSGWPLFESLHFLKPHILPRASRSTQNMLTSPQDHSYASIFNEHSASSSLPPLSPPFDGLTGELSNSPNLDSHITFSSNSSTPVPASTATEGRRKRKGKSESDVDNAFREAAVAFKKACEMHEEKQVRKNSSQIENFMKVVEISITEMSAARQTVAMGRMMGVLMALQRKPEP